MTKSPQKNVPDVGIELGPLACKNDSIECAKNMQMTSDRSKIVCTIPK